MFEGGRLNYICKRTQVKSFKVKKKVLVVEDDKVNAFIIKKLISDKFEPEFAYNPEEAKVAFKRNDDFFAVLMDMDLGDAEVDGADLLKIAKADKQFSHVPVVATTAYALDGDREKFLKMGFDEYLSKPIDKVELIGLLESLEASAG